MLTVAIMIFLGSFAIWYTHHEYEEIYEYLKDEYPEYTKEFICSTLCKNDFKIIIVVSCVLYLISSALLFVSIGALITFITLKLPSLERALISE